MIPVFTEWPKIMRKLTSSSRTMVNQKREFSSHRKISISKFVFFPKLEEAKIIRESRMINSELFSLSFEP